MLVPRFDGDNRVWGWSSSDDHFLVLRSLQGRYYFVGTEKATIPERRAAYDSAFTDTPEQAMALLAATRAYLGWVGRT